MSQCRGRRCLDGQAQRHGACAALGGFQGSPIQAAPLTGRPQLQAAGIVWHAAASDYASLLPMTATLHSGRVGVKQFASQAIEPIGGGGPGGGAWTA